LAELYQVVERAAALAAGVALGRQLQAERHLHR